MTSRGDQRHHGEGRPRIPQPHRRQMSVQMVHGVEGQTVTPGDGLGGLDPHQQSADETGADGGRDGTQCLHVDVGLAQGLAYHDREPLHVSPAGHLGNHPAIALVDGVLGMDDIGQHLSTGSKDGRRGVVA